MTKHRLALVVLALGLALAPGRAAAVNTEDLEETDQLPAVQNRQYRTQHEFMVGVGMIPEDAFYKALLLSGGYAWHINDLWAAEGQFYYTRTFKTDLRTSLEENFTIPTTRFAELKWYVHGGLLFKPLYGKLSLFNSSLVYGELFLSAHFVAARLEGGKATDLEPQGKGPRMGFGGAPGFGIRGYLNEYISARVDLRVMIIHSAGEMHYPLSLSLHFAVTPRTDL